MFTALLPPFLLSNLPKLLSLVLPFTLLGTLMASENEKPDKTSSSPVEVSELQLKPERVIVFKDGYCLVVKQGVATTDSDGVVFTDEVPNAAVLGSFWAVPEKGTIQSMVAGWVDTESKTQREITCTSILEIVKSNLGKPCSLEVGEQRIDGILLKILSNEDAAGETLAASHFDTSGTFLVSASALSLPAAGVTTTTVGAVNGTYFLIRTQSGDKMIQVSSVSNLTIENMNSSIEQTVIEKSRHKRLSMNFGQPNVEVKISLMYFRPDVRWIPTYRVNLTGQAVDKDGTESVVGKATERKKAELIMQGEILNEAEDFINVPFHVVVGVPNFRFRTIPSPMVLEATLRNSLAQAAPDIMGNGNYMMNNAFYNQRSGEIGNNRPTQDQSPAAIELPDELIGKGGNDLFVYELAAMTLKRGERALVPILRTEAVYRDIYTWDIELTHSENYAANSADSPSPLVLSEAKIWRQVELINSTDIPWTTGAAMIVDDQQPLAQELLTYTSPGGICRLPVTVSVDLHGKAEDSEVKREFNALKWRGYDYARVNGEIGVELTNHKTEPVQVAVRLRFGGKATRVSDDGKITLEGYRPEDWRERQGNPINNSSVVRWNATVEPGTCFRPTADYEFYLQH